MSKPTKKELDQRRRERTKANREKREKAKKRSGQIINIQIKDERTGFWTAPPGTPPPTAGASSIHYSPDWMRVDQFVESVRLTEERSLRRQAYYNQMTLDIPRRR